MKNLGSPQQHGHLPGGEGLDAVQGEQHFQIMTVEGFVHGHELVYQIVHFYYC